MNTADLLASYEGYTFRPDVVDHVVETIDRIRSFDTYQDLFKAVGFTGTQIVEYPFSAPAEVLDIRPNEHDPRTAIVVDLPMANPLDPNNIYQVASIAAANPDRRVIAMGNPSAIGFKYGQQGHAQRRDMGNGAFSGPAAATWGYLEEQRVYEVDRVGYSYGVNKLMAAAWAEGGASTRRAVAIEPVLRTPANKPLRRIPLGLRFAKSASALQECVEASGLPTFEAARDDSVGALAYNLGLLRLTNLAAAKGIGRDNFFEHVEEYLDPNQNWRSVFPKINEKLTVAWGSDSELCIDGLMSNFMQKMSQQYGDHVNAIRLVGQRHAFANTIPVQLAIVQEGVTDAPKAA